MKPAFVAVAVVITLYGTTARAGFETGNDILSHCTASNPAEIRRCWGYLEAVADAMVIDAVNGFRACFWPV